MGTQYPSVLVSGYNLGAPPDDGTTSAANTLTWAKHKSKIGDPLKTAIESINTNLLATLDQSVREVSATGSLVAGDHDRTVQIIAAVTAAIVLSLGDAVAMASGYVVTINNQSAVAHTIGRTTGTNTINGTTSNITLAPYDSVKLLVNASANGYVANGRGFPTRYIVAPGGSAPLLWLQGTGGVGGMCYMNFEESGTTAKMSVGMLGNGEANVSFNMDYSSGIHRFFDQAKNAFWLAMNENGVYMQYAAASGAGGDVWDNSGDLYTFVSKASDYSFHTGGSIAAHNGISSSGQNFITEFGGTRVIECQSITYGTLATASTRADGNGNAVGRVMFTADANIANHKTLAYMECTTNGSTATDRGGKLEMYVKNDGAITFSTFLSADAAGNVYLPTDKTTASAANMFWDNATSGALKRSTSLEEVKNRLGALSVADSKHIIFNADWFEFTSLIPEDDPDKVMIGTGARGIFRLDKRFSHYDKDEPSGVQYERFVAPLSVISKDHDERIRVLEERLAKLEAK